MDKKEKYFKWILDSLIRDTIFKKDDQMRWIDVVLPPFTKSEYHDIQQLSFTQFRDYVTSKYGTNRTENRELYERYIGIIRDIEHSRG